MLKILGKALIMVFLMILITGLAYPLAVTGLSQLIFPTKANGSIIEQNGKIIGSELIGQRFDGANYFHSRPSASGKDGYDATASAGSNLGPTNKTLWENASKEVAQVRSENGLTSETPVPSDLVTSSASGLDPHITPDAALVQVARVAKSRGLDEATVKQIVSKHTERRQFEILGEPRVNVLKLNIAIDQIR